MSNLLKRMTLNHSKKEESFIMCLVIRITIFFHYILELLNQILLNVPQSNFHSSQIFYTLTCRQNYSLFPAINIMLITSNSINHFDIYYDDLTKLISLIVVPMLFI